MQVANIFVCPSEAGAYLARVIVCLADVSTRIGKILSPAILKSQIGLCKGKLIFCV